MTSIMVTNGWVKRAFRKPETSYQQLPDFDFVWMLTGLFYFLLFRSTRTTRDHHTFLKHYYCMYICAASLFISLFLLHPGINGHKHGKRRTTSFKERPPNILEILVDDLGYGDTSVAPFTGLGVSTPNLERMASKGTTLTNYHTAAATCTPTRASILTGMYPWRLGIKSVFEYGERHTNRNDWLVSVPTIPMVLREANYTVTHSGKWHLGGMRNDDHDLRMLPIKPDNSAGSRRCPHPGPNQQGFKNYISVLDGPGSPRQNRLQLKNQLYSQGCTALLHNDIHIEKQSTLNITGYLSYCEAEHAIREIHHSVTKKKPFFIQLWFHAPHAPLEGIPGYPEYMKKNIKQGEKFPNGSIPYRTVNATLQDMGPTWKYRSMIADMDFQLGRVMNSLKELGIENNTLVVFTSDNGPENSAGTTAGLREQKRSLYEGGIRVPAIVQWVGTVPAGTSSDAFVVSTDLFPTFLDAAGVLAPPHLRLDGLSFLPLIVPGYHKYHTKGAVVPQFGQQTTISLAAAAALTTEKEETSEIRAFTYRNTSATAIGSSAGISNIMISPLPPPTSPPAWNTVDIVREDPTRYTEAIRDRITLWHNDYEGNRRTVAWIHGFKIILNENEKMYEMYDMTIDTFENHNLLKRIKPAFWDSVNETLFIKNRTLTDSSSPLRVYAKSMSLKTILKDRSSTSVHVWIAAHLYKPMQDYVRGGNYAHQQLLFENPGWFYTPTVLSDYRSDFIKGKHLKVRASPPGSLMARAELLQGSCGKTLCSCDIPTAHQIPSLPFERSVGSNEFDYLSPGKLHDTSSMLNLKITSEKS